MDPLWIFRHVDCEGPGYLAEFLDEKGVPWTLLPVDEGAPVPDSLAGAAGLVFMGGPMSVNDDHDWIQRELNLIRKAAAAGLPVLGHCLGGQLIARALGAEVCANPVREIGWHPVHAPDPARLPPGVPGNFVAFHWHGETFALPEGARLLLSNDHCPHQAFARDNILAFQCHVEMTPALVREWVRRYADELDDPSPAVETADAITADLERRCAAMQHVAAAFYARWLRGVAGCAQL